MQKQKKKRKKKTTTTTTKQNQTNEKRKQQQNKTTTLEQLLKRQHLRLSFCYVGGVGHKRLGPHHRYDIGLILPALT